MNKLINLLLVLSLAFYSCNRQTNEKKNIQTIEDFKNEMLHEDEMEVTTEKAVSLIQDKKYTEFKNLFADDVKKYISDNQTIQTVDQINLLFQNEGIPTGEKNIISSLDIKINGNDTIFINNIIYKFNPISDGSNTLQKVLIFSFLKKYGTKKLFGLSIKTNPFSAGDAKPTIKQLDNFDFNLSDITKFWIYYDEGLDQKTKFKYQIGHFAVRGDLKTLESSGIMPIVQSIFSDLKKSTFENSTTFNSTLNKENAKFIQAEFWFKDKPFSLYIYLPIKNGGKYNNKIIIMQRQYANLGYEFTLNQKDYPKITSEFPKIIDLNLDKYYMDKP